MYTLAICISIEVTNSSMMWSLCSFSTLTSSDVQPLLVLSAKDEQGERFSFCETITSDDVPVLWRHRS